jgi:hypothetical protein
MVDGCGYNTAAYEFSGGSVDDVNAPGAAVYESLSGGGRRKARRTKRRTTRRNSSRKLTGRRAVYRESNRRRSVRRNSKRRSRSTRSMRRSAKRRSVKRTMKERRNTRRRNTRRRNTRRRKSRTEQAGGMPFLLAASAAKKIVGSPALRNVMSNLKTGENPDNQDPENQNKKY